MPDMARPLVRTSIVRALVLFALYLVAAELGNALSFQTGFSTIWPPAGLVVAYLLMSDKARWPYLLIAAIAANLTSDAFHGREFAVSIGFALANATESFVASWMVTLLVSRRISLSTLREVFVFVAVAVLAAPIVGASLGTLVVLANAPAADALTVWGSWWLGDVLGILLVAGAFLSGANWGRRFRRAGGVERRSILMSTVPAVLITMAFMMLSWYLFSSRTGATGYKFLLYAGIMSAGAIAGPFMGALSALAVTFGGIASIAQNAPKDVFIDTVWADILLQAQGFFSVAAVTSMALSAAIWENKRLAEESRLHAADIEKERVSLELAERIAGMGSWRLELPSRRVEWSDSLYALFGIDDPRFVPTLEYATETAVHPDDRAAVAMLTARTLETGETARFEFRIILPDGRVRWVVSQSRMEYDASGNLTSIVGFLQDIDEVKRAQDQLKVYTARLERQMRDVTVTLGKVVETRDPYTQGHELGVARVACAIARQMGISQSVLDSVETASLIHDIGKLSVPAEILSKPGQLSEIERAIIREHSHAGYEILSGVDYALPIAEIVHQHHERNDGSGYPVGLRGEDILPAARIIAVADVIEAMTSHRPYRPAHSLEAALAEVCVEGRFHPEVVDAALSLYASGELVELLRGDPVHG